MAAGVDYYLLKPINIEVLLERIRQLGRGIIAREMTAPTIAEASSLETQVTDYIRRLGIPSRFKGYYYAREAIIMLVENGELLGAVTKKVYPAIAEKFDTTPSRVERAIRHSIIVACSRGNSSLIHDMFGPGVQLKGTVSNSEFIATIADRLKDRLE